MTDKQIIIDRVDVSGCKKQGKTIAGITCGNGERIRLANEIITKHKLCKDNPNCYYKQLMRTNQKLDKIKKRRKLMNEDFFKGLFIALLILNILALVSDKGFSNKQLMQLNSAIEEGISNAR